ncbi:Nif3-like dinuclear metal center hexameric protein [Spirochaetota bacterium]
MKISEFLQRIEELFPLSIQEDYDNSGSQILFDSDKLTSVMLCLDVDEKVVDESIENGCNLIVSHHPLFFKPINRVVMSEPRSKLMMKLIENRTSLYAAHTNLDKIYYDKLAKTLGLNNLKLIFKTNSLDSIKEGQISNVNLADIDKHYIGFGVTSELENNIKLKEFLKIVKKKLKLDFIVYSGNPDGIISNVAVLNGAGGNSIEDIIGNGGVDCIITGDIGYHNAKFANMNSVSIIDAGHFGTERILLDFLKVQIQDCLTKKHDKPQVKIYLSQSEKNPYSIYI